jgi:hypothetical protein
LDPNPRSEERISRGARFLDGHFRDLAPLHVSTPSGLQHPFGCLRPAQGSIAGYLVSSPRLEALSDPCPRLLRGCGNSVSLRLRASRALRLAVKMNSLARDSKRITGPWASSPCTSTLASAGTLRTSPSRPCTPVTAWFQALFTPLPRSFSAFPHGTTALSVLGCV